MNTEARLLNAERQMASLAAQQQSLTSNVQALTQSVSSIAKSMSDGFDKVETQIKELGDRSRPQLSTLVAAFGAVVVVVGWYARSEIGPIQTTTGQLAQRLDDATRRADRAEESVAKDGNRLSRIEEWIRLKELK